MLLVPTCASISLLYACKVNTLWVTVVVKVSDWKRYPPVGGRTFPYEFHIIHIHCVLGSQGYIIGWFPLLGYQLEF